MTINHINLIVTDVNNAISFFETYFKFKCTLVKGDQVIAILKNSADFTLVLMADTTQNVVYPKNFHIGFMLNTTTEVEKIYQQLKTGNIVIAQEPKKIRNSFGFYFYFENILLEVVTQ